MKTLNFLAAILIMVTIPAGCMPVQELEECVSLEPASDGEGAGYELERAIERCGGGRAKSAAP
jgi:hypothetical protein